MNENDIIRTLSLSGYRELGLITKDEPQEVYDKLVHEVLEARKKTKNPLEAKEVWAIAKRLGMIKAQ